MNNLVESTSASRLERTSMDDVSEVSIFNDDKWEWSFLRKKCVNLELEQYYESYMQRLRLSYLTMFIILQLVVAIAHSALLLFGVSHLNYVYMDICVYIGTAIIIWMVLSLNFREDLVLRCNWIMYVTSWTAITILVISDLSVPLYHSLKNHDFLRPAYGSYIIFATYIFMPLPSNVHAFIMGLAVTLCYLVSYNFVTYRKKEQGVETMDLTKLLSEGIFLACVNMFGIYFRLMKEIAIRTTFLDRRQCVEENLLLRYARDQEKNLLLSIIPAQIANKIEQDVKMRIEQMKQQNQRTIFAMEHRKLFIEPHNDVSILYADVVNYTYLTTTLDVKTLVETIHDLFVKFDIASEEYNVLRIKFLGDCYYCVAGVPIPNELHAKCCVDLGLRMIKDIRDVRTKRELDIDMRIGVHSGNILSGVIGASKWQYDIWSRDVDIANRLEQTGVAGRVHVSEQTLKLLDGEYMYEEGTRVARTDLVLRKYRIRTFLIKPPKTIPVFDIKRFSMGARRQIENRQKNDMKANFMQNTIVQYNQIRAQTKLEMNREMDKMPIGRIQITRLCFGRTRRLTQDEIEEQSFRSNITSCCLFFKDWRWEVAFMKEPDVMIKYSLLFSTLTFLAILAVVAINEPQAFAFWIGVSIYLSMFALTLTAAWYKKFWKMTLAETVESMPQRKLSLFFYRLSEKIQASIWLRVTIYTVLMAVFTSFVVSQLLGCDRLKVENEEIDIQLLYDGERGNLCFNPWSITEALMMAICMGFLFTRIPFILKFSVAVLLAGCYSVIVIFEYDFIYEKSPTTNVGLYAEYAHLMALLITLAIFHLMDRQTEFISKVDFNWNRQLQKKQDDAKFTNETIKILINNILPSHVADIYMTKKMQNELYFEEYDNVAVMFATIKNYDTEKVGLRVLNEIICDFDAVLNFYKGPLKIEKIKVAGWTYMAACGLDLERSEISHRQNFLRSSTLLPNGRRSQYLGSSASTNSQDVATGGSFLSNASNFSRMTFYEGPMGKRKSRKVMPQPSSVIYVMAQFALDLMRTMNAFNLENLQYEDVDKDQGMLRIGIASGEIMAGVVGSYKPHYDIWGNSVNIASRMDSTGVPGRIQVTEETARILESFDVACFYRGQTFVKGLGEIPTYFIGIDKELNFIRPDSSDIHSYSSYESSGQDTEAKINERFSFDDSAADYSGVEMPSISTFPTNQKPRRSRSVERFIKKERSEDSEASTNTKQQNKS